MKKKLFLAFCVPSGFVLIGATVFFGANFVVD